MRKRGRPPHPDVLTPREWQVLDLLRQGLTNEQIALRLDVSLATAKYHVSEILSKLNVTTREQAAAWQPPPEPARRWWALSPITLAKAGAVALVLATVAPVALLAWGEWQGGGSEEGPLKAEPASVDASPPALPLGRFVFGQQEEGDRTRIYMTDATGRDPIPLTPPPSADYHGSGGATWSPDGQWIAFVSGTFGLGSYGSVFVMRPDGTGSRELGPFEVSDAIAPCSTSRGLEWSPDSRRLAYFSEPSGISYSGPAGILLIDVESGQTIRVISGIAPTWSPDGEQLAYTSWRPPRTEGPRLVNDDCKIVITRVNEQSEEYELTSGLAPVWSPDGTRIAFSRDGGLFVIGADGSGERQLISARDLPDPTVTPFGVSPPALLARWSPDGERILTGANGQIVVIEVESGAWTDVATGYFPQWTPDGNWVAYHKWEEYPDATPFPESESRPERTVIYMIPYNGSGGAIRVTEGGDADWEPIR